MTSPLDSVRDMLANKPGINRKHFIAGWDACLTHLAEQVEFDEDHTLASALDYVNEASPALFKGLKWQTILQSGFLGGSKFQFDQMKARVGIEQLRVENIARERNELEARLDDQVGQWIAAKDEANVLRSKLTAAEARQHSYCERMQAAEARLAELEAEIRRREYAEVPPAEGYLNSKKLMERK